MLIIDFPDMKAIRYLFVSPDYALLSRQFAMGSRIFALRGFALT